MFRCSSVGFGFGKYCTIFFGSSFLVSAGEFWIFCFDDGISPLSRLNIRLALNTTLPLMFLSFVVTLVNV